MMRVFGNSRQMKSAIFPEFSQERGGAGFQRMKIVETILKSLQRQQLAAENGQNRGGPLETKPSRSQPTSQQRFICVDGKLGNSYSPAPVLRKAPVVKS
ncbi:MAG: hypothetical protein SFU86_13935 [Pirellulaceae bacterium]|nr:hypothetical protein [Pirellulaceae bacterium]